MLASNLVRDKPDADGIIPMIGKGFLHRLPLQFIPEVPCLKNAYASADNAYFIFHLRHPHISYSTKQVPGYFDDCFIGYHHGTVFFI
jgi:hypothetical protein